MGELEEERVVVVKADEQHLVAAVAAVRWCGCMAGQEARGRECTSGQAELMGSLGRSSEADIFHKDKHFLHE